MSKNGFRHDKKFGQNFLTDRNLLEAIVRDAEITSSDTVLEIGAGAGALTKCLAAAAGRVVALEIDKRLEPILDEELAGFGNIDLRFCDALKLPDGELLTLTGKEYKVVANLPYYITTPLIFKFLESDAPPVSMTIMMQKEVAVRLTAKEGTAEYGALTVAAGALCNVTLLRGVSRKLFVPVPNVDSAVVRLDLKERASFDKAVFGKLVRAAFHMRRKTLANNLIDSFGLARAEAEGVLARAGFDLMVRGERLSTEDLIHLSAFL